MWDLGYAKGAKKPPMQLLKPKPEMKEELATQVEPWIVWGHLGGR